ncbi:MAG TPA: adenylate/guanylate cyclase domain-containing protein [Anaerolineales bacterium]
MAEKRAVPKRAVPKRPNKTYLRKLLSERNQNPDRAAKIDEEIRQVFERMVAILVLDMSGFSRLTAKHGIVHYLAMIEQMEGTVRPAVKGNHGHVIKQEADNLFAIFGNPVDALEAALDIFRAFDAINTVLPDERDIHGAIGIGYGETLVVGDEDLFGPEMNLASKLGEDIAVKGQILLTKSACNALPAGRYSFAQDAVEISGMKIDYFRYESLTSPKA